MNSKVTIKRLATGVPGLDRVLGGGLPGFSFSLIAGPPGCGKTTLKMLRCQQQHHRFDNSALDGRGRFISLADEAAAGQFDRVPERLVAEVRRHRPAFVFVDLFRSVMMVAGMTGPTGRPTPCCSALCSSSAC